MKSTSRNKEVVMNAMELARMTGIMETLGNLPDGFFQEHKEELLCMAGRICHTGKKRSGCFL